MTKWTIKKKANEINESNANEIVSDIKDILNHSTIKFDKIRVEYDRKQLYVLVEYHNYNIARLSYGSYGQTTYDLECMFPPIEFEVKDDNDIQEQFRVIQAINKTLEELTQYLKMNGII